MTKGERTHARIVDIAFSLFLKHGVHGISFHEIADRAKIAHPTVYKHFRSKEELLLACAQAAIKKGRDYVDSQINPHEPAPLRLQSFMKANLALVRLQHKESRVLLAMYYYGLTEPALRALHSKIDSHSSDRILTHLIQGNHERAWALENPRPLARIIQSLLAGEMIKQLRDPDELSERKRFQECWSQVSKLCGLRTSANNDS